MTVYEELKHRGFIYNETPELNKLLSKPITFYFGIDPTADSLTLGNYMIIKMAEVLLKHGHHCIVVIGDLTAGIGDPSGKNSERELMNDELIGKNSWRLENQINSLLAKWDVPGFDAYKIVRNSSFFKSMNPMNFLQQYGKHITVNQMLAKDSVQNRMESGISFLEFSYQIFQGADFQYLNQKYNCQLQIGGSDQWGNIVTGIDFCRKMNQKEVAGLTCPLLTKSNGDKFGKSESGNVWLSKKKTSPWDLYQFFFSTNVDDNDLEKLIKIFAYDEMKDGFITDDPIIKRQQLAEAIVCQIHGQEELDIVKRIKLLLFELKPEELVSEDWLLLHENYPHKLIGDCLIDNLDWLINNVKEIDSKSELQRQLKAGSIKINGSSIGSKICEFDLINNYAILQIGKKNKYLLKYDKLRTL